MILKYGDGIDPFRGEVVGGVYQRYASGQQLQSTKKNDRYPNSFQWQRASTLIGLTRYWRMLSGTQQTAWTDFATAYPQPTQWNPARFLNGYNLFCRWNFFNRLVNGQATPILTTPAMSTVADSILTATITNNAGQLILDASWSRSGSDIWAAVFMSRVVSAGVNYIASQPRFIFGLENSGGVVYLFGALYNYYAVSATGNSSLCPVGSHVITQAELVSLRTAAGGVPGGGNLKDTSLDFWNVNMGATNSLLYHGRGAGYRSPTNGSFLNYLSTGYTWGNQAGGPYRYSITLIGASISIGASTTAPLRSGYNARIVKDSTTLSNGQTGTYTGVNGLVYPTICISGMEIIQMPLCETLFRDGTAIPNLTVNSDWYTTTQPAFCDVQNDPSKRVSVLPSTFDITSEYVSQFGRIPKTGDKILIRVIKFNKVSGQFLPEQSEFLTVL